MKEMFKKILLIGLIMGLVISFGIGLGYLIHKVVKVEKAAKLYSTEMRVYKIYKDKLYKFVLDKHNGYHAVYTKDSLWASPNEKIILIPEHKMKDMQDSLTYYKNLIHEKKCSDRE